MRRETELHVNFGNPGFAVGSAPGRAFQTVLPDGAWRGARCVVVAGGPSLGGLDLSWLDQELTIGVNRSIELLTPSVWFSADPQVVQWIEDGTLGPSVRMRFEQSGAACVKCVVPTSAQRFTSRVTTLRCHEGEGLSVSLSDGVFTGSGDACNSGLGALNLALCLGADPIYLLGFDMSTAPGARRTWCDEDYPAEASNAPLDTLVEEYVRIAEAARRRARIINLNPESALRCFEFGRVEDILPIRGPER